jgi:hypothetical protein
LAIHAILLAKRAIIVKRLENAENAGNAEKE